MQGREARAAYRVVFQAKWIVHGAEGAAALTDYSFLPLMEPTANHDERRQFRVAAAHARHHASGRRPHGAGQRLAVEADAAGGAARQADGTGDAVIA